MVCKRNNKYLFWKGDIFVEFDNIESTEWSQSSFCQWSASQIQRERPLHHVQEGMQ